MNFARQRAAQTEWFGVSHFDSKLRRSHDTLVVRPSLTKTEAFSSVIISTLLLITKQLQQKYVFSMTYIFVFMLKMYQKLYILLYIDNTFSWFSVFINIS